MIGRRVAVLAVVILVAAAVIWRYSRREHASPDRLAEKASATHARGSQAAAKLQPYFAQRGAAERRIAGTVISDAGPVANATVRLVGASVVTGLDREARATTDGAGHFDFGDRGAMPYTLAAEAPKLIGAARSLDLRDPTQSSNPIVLVLHACEASIHGVVRDTGSGVIARAHVTRELALGLNTGNETDDAGTFDLCVPMGDSTIAVQADGYARATEPIAAYGPVHHDFVLGPEATITGHAVRVGDHAAVADAVIELRAPGGTRSSYTKTDSNGRFNFDAIAPGRHSIIAYGGQLASIRPLDVIAEVGIPTDNTIELAATFSISGKVVDHAHSPIAGVAIRMTPQSGAMRMLPDAVTQQDGTFVLDHLLPGDYKPAVFAHPIADAQVVTLGTSDVNDVVVEIAKLGTISGLVTHHGRPVDGANVYINRSANRVVSDAAGTYTLHNVTEGSWEIGAESKRLGTFTHGPSVTVAKEEDRTGVNIEMELAGSVSGIVVDQHDAPVPGVIVQFILGKTKDFGFATTTDDGTFESRTMSGGGDYVIQVQPTQNSPLRYHSVDGTAFPLVSVADGDSHVRDLKIKIQLDRLAISGRVVDAQGQPVSDVTVRATPVTVRTGSGPSAMTDGSGAYAIRDLLAGDYGVVAKGARGEGHENLIAAGTSDLVLHLESLGALDGTLSGFTEVPDVFVNRDGDRVPSTAIVSATSFHAGDLLPGSYRVVARTKGGFDIAVVAIAGNVPATVAMHQRGFGTVTGVVTDEVSHAPLANVRCVAMSVPRELDYLAGEANRTANTDGGGNYRFERVVEGTLRVVCEGASGTVDVSPGNPARLDLATHTR